jgi:thymidylate kinase
VSSSPQPTLRDRLRESRDRSFQGRAAELARLEALLSPDSRRRVAFVHGPGGVGKTTLLRALEERCNGTGWRCVHVDGRDVEPRPEALRRAIARELGVEDELQPLAAALGSEPALLALDTFELLRELEDWLRRELIPALPDAARVCIAGRRPPSPDWSVDLGWEPLLDVFELRNFGADDAREFLTRRGVAGDDVAGILALTHGHPLALALAVELVGRSPGRRFDADVGRDVLRVLLERFQRDIPDSLHRRALEASAVVRTTTESILRHLLEVDDVSDLFAWLSDLSFMESGPHGLFPHDLVRDAIVVDLSRRDPDRRRALHVRARRYYTDRMLECWEHPIGAKPLEILYSAAFLHRNNPAAVFFRWSETELFALGTPRSDEWQRIEQSVEQLEGREGVRWLRWWRERQPEAAVVVRDRRDEPVGFALLPVLSADNAQAASADPAAAAAWQHLEREAPLRGEETALVTRFWLSLERLQGVTAESNFLFLHTINLYLTRPQLAYAVAWFHDPDFWAQAFGYLNYARLPRADYEIGGRRIGAFGIDWRRVSPRAWLELLSDRELDPNATWAPGGEEPPVLARGELQGAVRAALKGFATPGGLTGNALTRSRCVRRQSEPGRSAESVLRERIRAAWEALAADPANLRAQDAIRHTYLEPIGTQERVAERMHVSFSTYRRHLQRGIEAIADELWEQELAGAPDGQR